MVGEAVANTGLVAADAGANVLGPPAGKLVNEFGVCDQGPDQSDHVRLAMGDDLRAFSATDHLPASSPRAVRRIVSYIGRRTGSGDGNPVDSQCV